MFGFSSRVDYTWKVINYSWPSNNPGIDIRLKEDSMTGAIDSMLIWDNGTSERSFVEDFFNTFSHNEELNVGRHGYPYTRIIRRGREYDETELLPTVLENMFSIGSGWRLHHLRVRKGADCVTDFGVYFDRTFWCRTEDGKYDVRINTFFVTDVHTLLLVLFSSLNLKKTAFLDAMLSYYVNNTIYYPSMEETFLV